jgi:hypothetical protein
MEETTQLTNEESNPNSRINMRPEEILNFIKKAIKLTEDECVAVTQNNTSSIYGFFDTFEDTWELMRCNKWRFVPINYASEYFYEKRAYKKANPDITIIIDGNTISNLEIIRNFSRAS